MTEIELTIDSLGAAGDGIASHQGARYFIADALPGETIRARVTGRRGDGFTATVIERLVDSPHRASPACRHFNDCGGCAVQHLDDQAYDYWKRGKVITALARRGLADVDVAPLIRTSPGARRRATIHAMRRKRQAAVGFLARGSHRIVALSECPVITPALKALIAPLGPLFAGLLAVNGRAEALMAETGTGIDLLIMAAKSPDLDQCKRLVDFADDHDLARISWRAKDDPEPELIIRRRAVRMEFGGVLLDLPPGGFLQPSAAGETILVAQVTAATAGAKRIVDLYAGCGALSFPMVGHARVHAVEGDAAMTAAMISAAAQAGLTGRITCETRDLERQPLLAKELAKFDAVVFDPPRAGAKNQAETLAVSQVPLIVALSCSPTTFARDARILIDGGYTIEQLQPIDQFPWSAHVEIAAVFRRR